MIVDSPPTPLAVDNCLMKVALQEADDTPIAMSQSVQRADFATLVHSTNDLWIKNVQLPRRSEDE